MSSRQEAILRLERIAASAQLLASDLKTHRAWHGSALQEAAQIKQDAARAHEAIEQDKAWAAADR